MVSGDDDGRHDGQPVRGSGHSELEPGGGSGTDAPGTHHGRGAREDGPAVRDVEGGGAEDVSDPASPAGNLEAAQVDGELLDEVDLEQVLLTLQKHWSGMLPEPEVFAQYPPEVQKRMMRWNDAWTIDESRRQDLIVDASVTTSKRGQVMAVSLCSVLVLLAFVLFLRGNNVGGGLMLGAPVMVFLGVLVKSALPNGRDTPERRGDSDSAG
jgi:hypothetical protein